MESFLSNVEQYWEEVKDQYDIEFDEFKKVCQAPFKFVKEVMSSGVLKNIRLKYFGVFEVSKSRVEFSKKTLQKSYEKGNVSETRYRKRLEMLENYQPPELFKACEADVIAHTKYRRNIIIPNNECE